MASKTEEFQNIRRQAMQANPELGEAAAIDRWLGTPAGGAAYSAYRAAAEDAPVKRVARAEPPVETHIRTLAEKTRTDGETLAKAVERVVLDDPALYDLYKREAAGEVVTVPGSAKPKPPTNKPVAATGHTAARAMAVPNPAPVASEARRASKRKRFGIQEPTIFGDLSPEGLRSVFAAVLGN